MSLLEYTPQSSSAASAAQGRRGSDVYRVMATLLQKENEDTLNAIQMMFPYHTLLGNLVYNGGPLTTEILKYCMTRASAHPPPIEDPFTQGLDVSQMEDMESMAASVPEYDQSPLPYTNKFFSRKSWWSQIFKKNKKSTIN